MKTSVQLQQLAQAIEVIRAEYRDIPATSVQILLLIAASPGLSQRDICKRAGITPASASRLTGVLGAFAPKLGADPLYLIEQVEDPSDRRNKLSFLTEKGKRVVKDMLVALGSKQIDLVDFAHTTAEAYFSASGRAR